MHGKTHPTISKLNKSRLIVKFLFSSVARKTVLFADGVAPGDESSSSGAEALRSPAKLNASKQRKRLRRKRTLKATGRKRLMERLKLPVRVDAFFDFSFIYSFFVKTVDRFGTIYEPRGHL